MFVGPLLQGELEGYPKKIHNFLPQIAGDFLHHLGGPFSECLE